MAGKESCSFQFSELFKWSKTLHSIHKKKNYPAYRRHRLSRHVWTVTPTLWNPAFLTHFCTLGHLFSIFFSIFFALFVTFLAILGTFCLIKIMCRASWVMSHMSCVTWHVPCVTYHVSHVTYHLPPVTNANRRRPSPAESPIINSKQKALFKST